MINIMSVKEFETRWNAKENEKKENAMTNDEAVAKMNVLNGQIEKVIKEEKSMTRNEALDEMNRLMDEIAKLKSTPVAEPGVKKNHKPGKASPTRKYVLKTKQLAMWGKVPQQQLDIADLLRRNMVVGDEYTEQEVFDMMIDHCGEYKSLYTSKQDPTYLFRYYRGLKHDGNHAGFIARNFIQVIG